MSRLVLLASLLAIAGLGALLPGITRQPARVDAAPRPVTRFEVVYKVPGTGPDGTVKHRTVILGSSDLVERELGSFTDATIAAENSSIPSGRAVVTLVGGRGQTLRIDVTRPGLAATQPPDAYASTAIGDDGALYEQRGNAVVALSDVGTITSSRPLPIPQPGTPSLDGKPTKVILPPTAARLGAVVSSGGHIFVFVDNSVNAIIYDLATGRKADLPGTGYVTSAALGSDGFLYATMIDPSRSDNLYRVGRFDQATLTLTRTWDTPIRLSDGPIDGPGVQLAASSRGEIWVLASQEHGTTHVTTLLRLDAAAQTLAEVTSPPNAGSSLQIGVDGNPYVFGGPARQKTYSIDAGRSKLVEVPEASGPQGSFVLAVFAR